MKVALISSADFDPNTGVSGTRLAFRDSLRNLGLHVDTFFMDDLRSFSGGLSDRLIFPWKVALTNKKWQEYDLIDVASGDSWVLSFIKNRPITVFSSHGLEHLAHQEILKESQNGNLNLSWKYPFYWGGYRLWEVANSIKRSDQSIFLNKHDRDYAIKMFGISPGKANIVPNGIPDYFLNRGFTKKNNREGAIKVAHVGSYIKRKGIDYTSKAMNNILKKYKNAEITFFGTGVDFERVHQDYDSENRERVHVVQRYNHSDLPKLLEEFDINLFSSLSEGFGKTLIECMACGLAPVTFETPGPLDIVSHMHDAIIVPRRNIELLEQGIEKLILNKDLLSQIQRNAYITAQKYSWNQAAQHRLNVYNKAFEQNDKKYESIKSI